MAHLLACKELRRWAILLAGLSLLLAGLACGLGGGSATAPPPPPAEEQAAAPPPAEEQAAAPPPAEEQAAEPPPAQDQAAQPTGTVPLTLVNEGAVEVCYVQISPTTQDTWGEDWLGDTETIPPGSTRVFDVPAGAYDMRALDCGEEEVDVQMGVDVTAPMEWTIAGDGAPPAGGPSQAEVAGVPVVGDDYCSGLTIEEVGAAYAVTPDELNPSQGADAYFCLYYFQEGTVRLDLTIYPEASTADAEKRYNESTLFASSNDSFEELSGPWDQGFWKGGSNPSVEFRKGSVYVVLYANYYDPNDIPPNARQATIDLAELYAGRIP